MIYDPEERGHRKGRCQRCGYAGWSDDSGECPSCEPEDASLRCPDCGEITNDGEQCGECLSQQASYYHPDHGGQG